MAVGIVKINAVRIARAAADFDASVLQRRLDALVIAGSKPQRHVVHLGAAVNLFVVFDFEKGDALATAFEKTLPRAFMIDFHAEEIHVEFLRPREILDVKDHVIDAGDFKRRFHDGFPPRFCYSPRYAERRRAATKAAIVISPQRHRSQSSENFIIRNSLLSALRGEFPL